MAKYHLTATDFEEIIDFEDNKPAALPRLKPKSRAFLGWNKYPSLHYGYMSCTANRDTELYAICTEAPAYIVESHFRGDIEDYTGSKCQFRRYILDIYLENAIAGSGSFRLKNRNNILYYVGSISEDGIDAIVKTDTHGAAYSYEGQINTSDILVSWTSREPIDASVEPKKLITIMLTFSEWDMGYGEIARRTSDDIIAPDRFYNASADDQRAYVSANFYNGVINDKAAEDDYSSVSVYDSEEAADKAVENDGELIARFAVMADSHIGARYDWGNYDWLYGIFDHLERLHKKAPLDFLLQLGDNIDDGYANTYKADYDTYLEVIKALKLCDPINPIDNRADGTIPNYELQGNHDTSLDTRFFREKLWFVENKSGKKAAFITMFTNYGGYPAVNFNAAGNYKSYRSYGVLTDEIVGEVEKNIIKAKESGAVQIILCNHFGISQNIGGPILPETGLGKIEQLCKKYGIKLYLNGHEHNPRFELMKYNDIFDYDVSMTKHKYAVFELRESSLKTMIYNTDGNTLSRIDVIKL